MKKLLLSVILISATFALDASHLRGGELTVEVDQTNKATFTLTLYGDGNGALLPSTLNMNLNGPGLTNVFLMLNRISSDTLSAHIFTLRNIYEGQYTLPQNGEFVATMHPLCCRSADIINIVNSWSTMFSVEATFNSYNSITSATPVFQNTPLMEWPLDTLWHYNPMAMDADGDSLYWSLINPFQGAGSGIYTMPPANSGGSMTIDPLSGMISYSASQLGVFVACILVEEFDSTGVRIGEIRRDIQFEVLPYPVMMMFNGNNGNVSLINGVPTVTFLADSTQELEFTLNDTSTTLSMSALGDPFQISGSNATFNVQQVSSGLKGVFSWKPDSSDLMEGPHRLNIRTSNGLFINDYTVMIRGNNNTGVEIEEYGQMFSGSLEIYPNPGKGNFKLDIKGIEAGEYDIRIYDLSGRVLRTFEDIDMGTVETAFPVDLDLDPGTYILNLHGETSKIRLFVID